MNNTGKVLINVSTLSYAFESIKNKDEFKKEFGVDAEQLAITASRSSKMPGFIRSYCEAPVLSIFNHFPGDVATMAIASATLMPSAPANARDRFDSVVSFYSTMLELHKEREMNFDYIGMTIVQAIDSSWFDLNTVLMSRYTGLVRSYCDTLGIQKLNTHEASEKLLDSDLMRLCFKSRQAWGDWKEERS